MQRVLVGVGLLIGGALLLRRNLPARLTRAAIGELRAQPPVTARLEWGYSAGIRPISLIIDLEGPQATSGSLTVAGRQTSGELPLAAAFSGPYRLNATATYRLLGIVRRTSTTFSGNLATRA